MIFCNDTTSEIIFASALYFDASMGIMNVCRRYFAHDVMRNDESKCDEKDVHMNNVNRVFGMRHTNESVLSYT